MARKGKRAKVVTVLLSDEEHAVCNKAADALGLAPGPYVRMVLLQHLQGHPMSGAVR